MSVTDAEPPSTGNNTKNKVTEWNYWSDTSMVITANSFIHFVVKGFPVYWINFANAFNFTRKEFAYILISLYLGGLMYPFLSPFNIYACNKSKYITIFYTVIAGLCMLSFMAVSYIADDITLKWSFDIIILFIFGFCATALSSNANHIASYYTSDAHIQERLIVALDLTWVFATLLLVGLGYAFDYPNGLMIMFSLVGIVLCSIAFIESIAWKDKFNVNEYELELEINNNSELLSSEQLMTTLAQIWFNIKHFRWLILAQSFSFIAWRMILYSMPGLWFEDIYGLTSSEVGIFCLIIAAIEFTATIAMSFTINKLGVWFFIPFNLTISVITLFIAIMLHSMSYIPLWFAKIMVLIIYNNNCIQFQCDLNVIVKASLFINISPRIMISIFFFIIYSAALIDVLVLANIWDHGNGLSKVLYVSFSFYVVASLIWIKIYKDDMFGHRHKYQRIEDVN